MILQTVISDVRYALRTFRKSPGFAAAAIFTIALGIGINSAIFSVVNTVLLQPLPYREPARLMTIYETEPELAKAPVTMPDLIDWRERSRSFETIGSLTPGFGILTEGDRPERLPLMSVTTNFFEMVGIQPRLGRAFTAEEGLKGRDRVIILSNALFQRRFGGDSSIIGHNVRMDGKTYTVVGVMPAGFRFLTRWVFNHEAWIPMVLEKNERMRGSHDRLAIGRLKAGVTPEQAQAEMSAIAAQLEKEHPASNGKIGAYVLPMSQDLTGDVREVLLALLGAVAFILLIACANVANLLLSRGVSRRQEFAIRTALGAGRGQIVRQLLTEGLLLAALGGIVGLGLAYVATAALRQVDTLNIARLTDISMDATVLLFSLCITGAAGVLSGIAPAFLQSRRDLNTGLRESSQRTVAGGGPAGTIRSLLVAAELALAVILLIGAGLMIRSVGRLLASPLGFRPEGVLTAQITLPGQQYDSSEKTAAFASALLERVRAIPGITAASVANKIPLKGGQNGTMVVEGQTFSGPDMEGPLVENSSVYPGYFEAMGIPLRVGRVFTDSDIRKDFSGLIVNETFVRVLLKNAGAVGKRVSYDKNPPHWHEIIGVVADTRQQGLSRPALPEVYGLSAGGGMTLVAHTTLTPTSLVVPIRRELATVDKELPLAEVQTMENILDLSSANNRTFMRLIGTFAAVALLLASIGIYGLVAFAMSQRRHEIGIRVALGATRGRIVGMALGSAGRLVLAGMSIGVLGSLLLTKYLKALLYEVSPLDPLTFASVPVFLALVTLGASFIPAIRAAAVDPVRALRQE